MAISEIGADVADLAANLAESGSPRVRGDAVAGALLAEAGTRAAAHLVRINLGATPEDMRVTRAEANVEAAKRSVRRSLAAGDE